MNVGDAVPSTHLFALNVRARRAARVSVREPSRHALPLWDLQNKRPLATEGKDGAELLCRLLLVGSGKDRTIAYISATWTMLEAFPRYNFNVCQ